MNTITASELKARGIQVVGDEVTTISYRGKPTYLILPESHFEAYEAFLLEQALREARSDIEAGRYSTDLDEHLGKIDDV
jgi:PHD/YefM family antitoxin component YafN of YafNO toxin-antitoxin module